MGVVRHVHYTMLSPWEVTKSAKPKELWMSSVTSKPPRPPKAQELLPSDMSSDTLPNYY